jgi:hypothetical protein
MKPVSLDMVSLEMLVGASDCSDGYSAPSQVQYSEVVSFKQRWLPSCIPPIIAQYCNVFPVYIINR